MEEVLDLRRKDTTIVGSAILIHIRRNAYRTSNGMKYQDTPKTSTSHCTILVFKKSTKTSSITWSPLATAQTLSSAPLAPAKSSQIPYRSVLYRP